MGNSDDEKGEICLTENSVSNQAITRLIFAVSALSAILLYAFSAWPLCFLLGFLPFTIMEAIIRPWRSWSCLLGDAVGRRFGSCVAV